MARLFFKDVPAEPTCSACGTPHPKHTDEDGLIYVCDEKCYVDWFTENKAAETALQKFYEDFYEIY